MQFVMTIAFEPGVVKKNTQFVLKIRGFQDFYP